MLQNKREKYMNNLNQLYLTTSWDDGDPLDYRIAELLSKHGIPGTFYVPCYNSSREVMSNSALRELSQDFEIGSHTLDHYPIDGKDLDEIKHQVVNGKKELENRIGKEVDIFCYPGGRSHAQSRKIVKDAGFKFARNTADFNLSLGNDPFSLPTTAQFRYRRPSSLAFNFAKWGNWFDRTSMLIPALKGKSMIEQLENMLEVAIKRGGVFHLWGHAYQIEETDDWDELDRFLGYLSEIFPASMRKTNGEIFNDMMTSK